MYQISTLYILNLHKLNMNYITKSGEKKQVLLCFYNWYNEEFHLFHNKELLPIRRPLNMWTTFTQRIAEKPKSVFQNNSIYFSKKVLNLQIVAIYCFVSVNIYESLYMPFF